VFVLVYRDAKARCPVADEKEPAASARGPAKDQSERPAGSAALWASWRQGLKELAQVLPAFPDGVRPVEEPGQMGNPTQAMVTQQVGTVEGYRAMLDERAARAQPDQGRDRGMER
jgi:hypothetical protein